MKGACIGSARYAWMVLLGLALLGAPGAASAQLVDVPPTWGGDFRERPRLTGSWWGLRDELGRKGVVFDVDVLLTPQGVVRGGRDTGWEFWGNADHTLNIDTGKLGPWPVASAPGAVRVRVWEVMSPGRGHGGARSRRALPSSTLRWR